MPKVNNNPFIGRTDGVPVHLQKDFDQEYKEIQIIDKVRKIGEGEDDYIIEKVVVVSFKPIQEVVDADKDSVGVYNIMRQVAFQNDKTMYEDNGDGRLVDLTGAPEDLMQLKQMGVDAEAAFNGLPNELRGEMDMESFVKNLSQEQFDAFIKAAVDRMNPVKKDGD